MPRVKTVIRSPTFLSDKVSELKALSNPDGPYNVISHKAILPREVVEVKKQQKL
ncbi:hypothetical protein PAMP_013027 [Pampus punctatissimus]